jgi:hypothetical protein
MGILGKLSGRKAGAEVKSKGKSREARAKEMTVKPTDTRTESEHWAQQRAFEQIESELGASGLFKPESVPLMMAAIKANSPLFCPVNANLILGKKARLEAAAARISLADCLTLEPSKKDDPATFIQALCTRCWDVARNEGNLRRMRAAGIKSVEINFIKETACSRVKRMAKIHAIDDVPQIPLPDCSKKQCHCFYRPVLDFGK